MFNKTVFYEELREFQSQHPFLRRGQAAFSLISDKYLQSDQIKPLVNTEFDPFYHDDRVRKFVDECERILNQEVVD